MTLRGQKFFRWAVAAACSLALGRLAFAADTPAASELIYLLQYIGVDYGVAVHDGRTTDDAEYQEVLRFAESASESYSALRPRGGAARDLTRLRDLIRSRAGWEAVRSLSQDLVRRLTDELDVVPYPAARPDLEAGRELYRVSCAACHGAVGGGDGPSSSWMTPRPTSFRAPVMSLMSPYQIFHAQVFGVPGTAMPSYRALTAAELWNIAFFVMTMRDGFDPAPPVETVPLTLAEISALSDEELLKRLRASRPGALVSEIDYYRGQFLPAAAAEAGTASAAPSDDGIAVALQLERVFARAAETVFPSVVGISLYEKAAGEPKTEGWQEGSAEEQLYPGYRRVASASGFVVSGDGEILTSAGIFARGTSDRVIDVELPGNVHTRGWVVGIEPTVDLAVLQIASPVPVRSASMGDSDAVKVGQWAIAVGDPPGAEKTFAPGTVAGRPERECYQEHRTSTLIQSSATIDPRALGGPLVNIHGAVIGLTVPGPEHTTVNALPINLAMTLYRALKVAGSERSPWLGISVLELNASLRSRLSSAPLTGIYIEDVFAPSPASRAGIKVGDILTKMDDHSILSVADFQTWLYILGIGADVDLEIVRGGKTLRLKAPIRQRPEAATPR